MRYTEHSQNKSTLRFYSVLTKPIGYWSVILRWLATKEQCWSSIVTTNPGQNATGQNATNQTRTKCHKTKTGQNATE